MEFLSCELFLGNNTDPITYIPAIEQVKKQYGIKRVVTVADKAMNSAKILQKHIKMEIVGYSRKR